MIRSRAGAGNARPFAVALAAALLANGASPCAAQTVGASGVIRATPDFWFAGTRLSFARPQMRGAFLAVGVDDPGLARFLAKLGATIAYQPGQNYVVVTTGDRRTVAFALGDPHVTVGGSAQVAAFAPYASGATAYLPFADLSRALFVDPVADGDATVLVPEVAALDVRPAGRATIVTLRGASPLHFRRTSASGDARLTLAFSGIATTLERSRTIAGGALGGVQIAWSGSPRNPTTTVTFDGAANGTRVLAPSDSPNVVSVAFAPPGVALSGTPIPDAGDATVAVAPVAVRAAPSQLQAPATQPPPAAAAPANGDGEPDGAPAAVPASAATPTADGLQAAAVTGVSVDPGDETTTVALAVAGPVTYEWHRLSDDRWYVDLKPATLGPDAQDVPVRSAALASLRVKGFVGPNDHLPTVRVALSLSSPRIVNVIGTPGGLALVVDRLDDLTAVRSGAGEVAGGKLVASVVPLPPVVAPPPAADDDGTRAPGGWKFSPAAPPGANPRLIVLDPGHGGSDPGSMHNGLVEKELTLDISRRLRALLVARGWLVRMTRETDVDVFQPNDDARDELQARCDVANNAGARLFISVHINSFTSSALNGTTTYYYKADSYGLADAIHTRLAAALPTADDGIRKDNFYVIHHTTAPAVLIETAFLSNPSDARLLKSEAFLNKVALGIANGVGDYASPAQPLSSTSSDVDASGN